MNAILLFISAFVAISQSKSVLPRDDCGTKWIAATENIISCTLANSYYPLLDDLAAKKITPTDVINKFCNEMNMAKCGKDLEKELTSCLSDEQRKGIHSGINTLDILQSFICTEDEKADNIEFLTNELECELIAAEAVEECGPFDVFGIINGFGEEGCKQMRGVVDCVLETMDFSGKCSEEILLSYRKTWNVAVYATPCGLLG